MSFICTPKGHFHGPSKDPETRCSFHIHLHSKLLGLRSPHRTHSVERGLLKVTWAKENVKKKLLLVLLLFVCLLRVLRSSKGKMGIFYLLIMLLIVELWCIYTSNVIWGGSIPVCLKLQCKILSLSPFKDCSIGL